MSQHTTRTEIQRTATQRVPTRTVAGSYESPVEGIVDYSAFQRGFESTFNIDEEEKVKLPEPFSDIDFSGGRGTRIGWNEKAIMQYKASVREKLDELQERFDLAVIRFGEGSRQAIKVKQDQEFLKEIVEKTDLGIQTTVGAEGTFDVQQARLNPSTQGVAEDGEGGFSPFYDLVLLSNQNDNSNFSVVIDYEKRTGGISANGYYYDVSALNETNANSLIPSKSDISTKATAYATKNKIELQTSRETTGGFGDSDEKKVRTFYTPASVNALNKGAKVFAEKNYGPDKMPVDYNAVLLDAVFGYHRKRNEATPENIENKIKVSFIDYFGPDGFPASDGNKYTFDKFKQHLEKKIREGSSDIIPENIEREYVQLFVEQNFLTNVGSELYTPDEYGYAVKRPDLEDITEREPDKPKPVVIPPIEGSKGTETGKVRGRLFNIASNLQESIYNVITPSTGEDSQFLDKDGYRDINIKQLTGGNFIDIDGTKATLESGRIVREGNNMFLDVALDAGRIGGRTDRAVDSQNRRFRIGGIRIVDGKQTLVPDFAGRKRFTEAVYRGTYSDDQTIGIATDLLTGDRTIYNDRALVQEAFKRAGKDDTMFRRLDVIAAYRRDGANTDFGKLNMTPEDMQLLKDPNNKSKLALDYRKYDREN